MKSKKRLPARQAGWPEKSARRVVAMSVEALIFLDFLVIPLKAGRKVTVIYC